MPTVVTLVPNLVSAMRWNFIHTSILLTLLSSSFTPLQAQIKTDASLGRAAQSLIGPQFLIPENLGKLAGNNLFHSFQTFNIGTGESATFTTTTPAIANVFSRVTGGSVSTINGALKLQAAVGTPSFFFINPAGVTFGAGASIDVPGAFHVTTADYVKFADGTKLHADLSKASSFSAAAPEAFGFLGSERGTVSIREGALLSTNGFPLDVVAGDVSFDNGYAFSGGGDIRIAAIGQLSTLKEVGLTGAMPEVSGDLRLNNGSVIDSSGVTGGGMIQVGAGTASLAESSVIGSFLVPGETGNAGSIYVKASGELTIANGSGIGSATQSAGNAGDVNVTAGSLQITGNGAGIVNYAQDGGGHAGMINIKVAGNLVLAGGMIQSNTYSSGHAGDISIKTDGTLTMTGGEISSLTESSGNAGSIDIRARSIVMEGGKLTTKVSASGSGRAGSIVVQMAEDLRMTSDAEVGSAGESKATTSGSGNVSITARNVTMDDAVIYSTSNTNAARIDMVCRGALELLESVVSSSSIYSLSDGGAIRIRAKSMLIDGRYNVAGVTSSSLGSVGNAGSIEVDVAKNLTLRNSGTIDSSAMFSDGGGGSVRVSAGNITIDGGKSRIGSAASVSTGKAGDVRVEADGNLRITNGGQINASSEFAGDAGSIHVAASNVFIDSGSADYKARSTGIASAALGTGDVAGRGGDIEMHVANDLQIHNYGLISAGTQTSGAAGSIRIDAGSLTVDGHGKTAFIGSIAHPGSFGPAGSVEINARGTLSLMNGGHVSSDSEAAGNAGIINVTAGTLKVSGQGEQGTAISTEGNFGKIEVDVKDTLQVGSSGFISSEAGGSNNAGSITVRAREITLDGKGILSGISSASNGLGLGGNVEVFADEQLRLLGKGVIFAGTAMSGKGGDIHVEANSIRASGYSGIYADAFSTGQTGSISVIAREAVTISNQSLFSIRHHGFVDSSESIVPTTLAVSAPIITLINSTITAASSGNVAASDITINASKLLYLDPSSITTSANQGNGGSITINGNGTVFLDKSQITTSVSGLTGNGGDITINSNALAMSTGFIQANTAAANASGGNIAINVNTLIPSNNSLLVGGNTPYAFKSNVPGYNVIQAAAPTGVSGTINVTSPTLDLSGSLTGLSAKMMNPASLGRNPCRAGGGSSLSLTGHGGLPPPVVGPIRIESVPSDFAFQTSEVANDSYWLSAGLASPCTKI